MLSETEIQNLKARFVGWLDDNGYALCDESDIVRTADTVQGFIDACREYRAIRQEVCDGLAVTIIEGSQRVRGEERRDLYILDVEENVRLVYA